MSARKTSRKFVGIIPARMQASRFPGKPLKNILGMPMVEHVYRRALLFGFWDYLAVATCDKQIKEFSESVGIPVVMTSDSHVRALDRVAEAVEKAVPDLNEDDIVVNVQGDEPMLRPDMFSSILDEFNKPDSEIV